MVDVVLLGAAAAFAVLNGANDGGALLAAGLKSTSLRPLSAAALLTVAVAAVPPLVGTHVAATLAERLVQFQGARGQAALLAAVVGAVAVLAVLGRSGLPTSLTLALIGGIVGAGLGGGLPVSWGMVAAVLAMAAIAPVAGALGAFAVASVWAVLAPARVRVSRQVRVAHRVGFALQCVAYGANDGQKMLAVFAVAGYGAAGTIGRRPGLLALIAGLFAVGILVGVRRYAGRLGHAVLPLRPVNAVTAQLSSAGAVLGSAAIGAPVSMTQAVAGGLIGSGLTEGLRRVRWQEASRIVVAWAVTLPAALLASAVLSTVLAVVV